MVNAENEAPIIVSVQSAVIHTPGELATRVLTRVTKEIILVTQSRMINVH
jgi:hypothetical protein